MYTRLHMMRQSICSPPQRDGKKIRRTSSVSIEWLRLTQPRRRRKDGFAQGLAVSYILFLLLCLALGVVLYTSSTRNAREAFWEHRALDLEQAVEEWDSDLSAMDRYTRQLLIDNTFVRFAGMEGIHQKGFVYTAYEVMQTLSARIYSISNLPVVEDRIYMKNSGYVISASQFTEVRQFYEDYRIYHPDGFESWLKMILKAAGQNECLDISAYTGRANEYAVVRDVDAIMHKSVPAVIWFELDMPKLRQRFLPETAYSESVVLVCDESGARQMVLSADASTAALADEMQATSHTMLRDWRLIRYTSPDNGWQYTIALPERLCAEALGNYDFIFWLMMLLALLMGCLMITLLVRRQMKPVRQLSTRLEKAEGDRDQLMQKIDSQRPMLHNSYLRKLLSGHVASREEFRYMMDELGIEGDYKFYVLYGIANRQNDLPADLAEEYNVLAEHIEAAFTVEKPVYYYTTLDRSFVILVTYRADAPDPLMDLQRRAVALHEQLLSAHGLWFYMGVGTLCSHPQSLWESYEQARLASRYTARHHIFLPYEMMSKDASSIYYPVEISAKLQHFITTGNREQVIELFALLHRENMEQRSLPVMQLNFLLSDLKNTLLKVRFQIDAQTADERRTLAHIDHQLSEQPTFAVLENMAQLICTFFTRSAEPSNPIPDVEKYLQENFTDPSMCLSKLSERFNMSESYLSHLFKDKTGQNFSTYLESLRLGEAVRRLGGESCNVSGLYAELGYNNPTTFRRAFKKRYGVAPSEMRAQMQR